MKKYQLKIRPVDEKGIVSIMVVVTIVIVLSLVTVAFSRIMSRTLRQALDRDLSTQAYYAAESGLNDARAYVINLVNKGDTIPDSSTSCLDTMNTVPFVGSISGDYNFPGDKFKANSDKLVKYTCILINPSPKELIYQPLSPGSSKVFSTTASNLQNLYFSWENTVYNAGANAQPLGTPYELPQESALTGGASNTNKTGLLRITIYPIQSSYAGDPNAQIAAASRTYFLYPNGEATAGQYGSVNFSASNGTFVDGKCNVGNRTTSPFQGVYSRVTPRFCNTLVSSLPAAAMYYVRLTAVYQQIGVSVLATNAGSGGQAIRIPNAEAVIDVTGQGNDVLRRLQARVPLSPNFPFPEYGIQSMDTLCKRFRLPKTGPGPNDFGPAQIQDQTDAASSDAAACEFL